MAELREIREEIDSVDSEMVRLFEKRMALCRDVAEYKIEHGKQVLDAGREAEKIEKIKAMAEDDFNGKAAGELFRQIMAMSRKMQYQIMADHNLLNDMAFKQVAAIKRPGLRIV